MFAAMSAICSPVESFDFAELDVVSKKFRPIRNALRAPKLSVERVISLRPRLWNHHGFFCAIGCKESYATILARTQCELISR